MDLYGKVNSLMAKSFNWTKSLDPFVESREYAHLGTAHQSKNGRTEMVVPKKFFEATPSRTPEMPLLDNIC